MSQYIGKQPIIEKALIQSEAYTQRSPDELILRGRADEFPGAYIEFRFKVTTPEIAKAVAASKRNSSSNMAKKAMPSQVTRSRASAILATQQPGSARNSAKPFGNMPWEKRQVSITEDVEQENRRTSVNMGKGKQVP